MVRLLSAFAFVVVGVFVGTRLVAHGILTEPVAYLITLAVTGTLAMIAYPPGYGVKRRQRLRAQRQQHARRS